MLAVKKEYALKQKLILLHSKLGLLVDSSVQDTQSPTCQAKKRDHGQIKQTEPRSLYLLDIERHHLHKPPTNQPTNKNPNPLKVKMNDSCPLQFIKLVSLKTPKLQNLPTKLLTTC